MYLNLGETVILDNNSYITEGIVEINSQEVTDLHEPILKLNNNNT